MEEIEIIPFLIPIIYLTFLLNVSISFLCNNKRRLT